MHIADVYVANAYCQAPRREHLCACASHTDIHFKVFGALDNFLKVYARREKAAPEEADRLFQRLQEEVGVRVCVCARVLGML